MDERIAYYKQKYGEDFEPTGSAGSREQKRSAEPAEKRPDEKSDGKRAQKPDGLFGRVRGLFKRKD
jgi:hypothetical protein